MRNKFSKSAKWYAGGFYISLFILLVTVLCIKDVVLVDKLPLDKGLWINLLVLLGNFAVKNAFYNSSIMVGNIYVKKEK